MIPIPASDKLRCDLGERGIKANGRFGPVVIKSKKNEATDVIEKKEGCRQERRTKPWLDGKKGRGSRQFVMGKEC